MFTFSATGTNTYDPNQAPTGPDGNNTQYVAHSGGAQNGISDLTAPINSLVGLFLTGDQPDGTAAPTALNFLPGGNVTGNVDYTTLSPALKQVFFIGDGKTAGNVVQKINAPFGATRLLLGTWDGFAWLNNVGSFDVTVNASTPATAIPVTASLQVPKNTNVTIVSNSFNVPPTQIVSGANFDTLIWNTTLTGAVPSQTFTWGRRENFFCRRNSSPASKSSASVRQRKRPRPARWPTTRSR